MEMLYVGPHCKCVRLLMSVLILYSQNNFSRNKEKKRRDQGKVHSKGQTQGDSREWEWEGNTKEKDKLVQKKKKE